MQCKFVSRHGSAIAVPFASVGASGLKRLDLEVKFRWRYFSESQNVAPEVCAGILRCSLMLRWRSAPFEKMRRT
jgi:hypothetical protein